MPLPNTATFLGVKKCGPVSSSLGILWGMNAGTAINVGQISVPGIVTQLQFGISNPNGVWYGYELDPGQAQGTFEFGVGQTLQLQVDRVKQYFVDATHNYIPGRTVAYVVNSGQVFVLGPRDCAVAALTAAGVEEVPHENDTVIIPVEMSQSSKIQIWSESDLDNGAITAPQSAVIAEIFNFAMPPVKM